MESLRTVKIVTIYYTLYLRETLSGFIFLETEEDCEVDPMKLQPGANLANNQLVLTGLVQRAWFDILSSFTKFPR